MRIMLIFFLYAFCIQSSRAVLYDTFIDDLEISIEKCSREGRQMKPESSEDCEKLISFLTDGLPHDHRSFCQKAFAASCLQELENFQCSFGVKLARKGLECQKEFRKCCIACKIGLDLKTVTGECFSALNASNDIIKNVTFNCCNQEDIGENHSSSEDYNEIVEETLPAKTRIELPPASLIAISDCSTFNSCGDEEECVKTHSGHKCRCKNGYEIGKHNECVDVDECQKDPCLELHKNCVNTPGSYKCENCIRGFEKAISSFNYEYEDGRGDGVSCVDIDECAGNNCESNDFCTNLPGSFRCTEIKCPTGYKRANPTSCKWETCRGRICHKIIQNFFKIISPNNNTDIVVHEFAATKFISSINPTYMKPHFQISSSGNRHLMKILKPLKKDSLVKLNIKNGRKVVVENVHVFVSS